MARQLHSTRKEEEHVFLVGLQVGPMKKPEAEASFAELHRLAETTDAVIVGELLVHVRVPHPGTFITEGLADALTGQIAAAGAGTAILDEDVSPAQQRSLESRWGVKVVNRSELILDIFARRAHTSEGKLQVELAQYQYRLPRLRGRGIELSRLGGGIGTRGPGEMKLETDRRVIAQRIHLLEQKILKLRKQRDTQRARRQESAIPTVALVGYTNAGKSTLLNALTGAEVFVEDKLFATLDPTTRRGKLPSGAAVTFTDTVGFINRLPTQLAAAFRATLEEAQHADLFIHVVDATSPRWEEEAKTTEGALRDLGAGATPTLTAWNKIDELPEGDDPRYYERRRTPSVAISARDGAGLDRLMAELQKLIDASRPRLWLRFDYKEYGEVRKLEAGANVHKTEHRGDATYVLVSLPPDMLRRHETKIVGGPPAEDEEPGA